MKPGALYIENEPFAAEWLRHLILFGMIAPGHVYEGDIQNVRPIDLDGYRQVHAFAGVGIWSLALRNAGWEDDRPVWTGSCPCQPFSLAGNGEGFADPRHLWPAWFGLIGVCRPECVLGEQVASAGQWLDLVHGDMESIGYTVGATDLPAAGFGGAHIRQRFFWVADTNEDGRRSRRGRESIRPEYDLEHGDRTGGLADTESNRWEQRRPEPNGRSLDSHSALGGLVDTAGEQVGLPGCTREPRGAVERMGDDDARSSIGSLYPDERGAIRIEGPAFGATGALRGCDWLLCQDGKLRPVEPATFPLAHAYPARVGRLRAYGNALDAETATQFIAAYMDVRDGA